MSVSLKRIIAISSAITLIIPIAACGSSNGNSSSSSKTDQPTTIKVWAWDGAVKDVVAGFEKAYPNIKVDFEKTGTGADNAKALNNAIAAGKGAPDVTEMLSTDVAKFAQEGSIISLDQYGANKYNNDFAPGIWGESHYNNKIYGLPLSGGPMAFFYNKEVFDKAGISEPPKTWDEFYEDAKKVRALGSGYYIANNAGDRDSYSEFNAFIWQLGGKPFKQNGDKLSINLTSDSKVKKYLAFQQKLIDEDLINTKVRNWTDDWFRSLGDGSISSLSVGAWMPTNLETSSAAAKGKWRVAPIPQWGADNSVNAEDGGSVYSVTKQSSKQAAAWKFVNYAAHGAGAKILEQKGNFPALKSILQSKSFQDQTNEYFGGQKVNAVLAQAAQMKSSKYQFLPFSTYAQSIFGDYLSKGYSKTEPLTKSVADYQKALKTYASQQGYTLQ